MDENGPTSNSFEADPAESAAARLKSPVNHVPAQLAEATPPPELEALTPEDRLSFLVEREAELVRKLNVNEENFGRKRAKFVEMYMQKEEQLKKERDRVAKSQQELSSLQKNHDIVKAELESLRTVTAIQESTKMDEIEHIKRQCHEEVASLNVVMKETIRNAVRESAQKHEEERQRLTDALAAAESELSEARKTLKDERDGVLAAVAKNLKKGVAGVTQGVAGVTQGVAHGVTSLAGSNANASDEALEEDMRRGNKESQSLWIHRRAQLDAEILRSVVVPLEDEAMTLKTYLSEANQKIRALEEEKIKREAESAAAPSDHSHGDSELEQRLEDVSKTLETEKASRTDLEMYVAVIETQKKVLQDEGDKLKKELSEICRLLALERHSHAELKRTWRHANDQFLEAQRQQMTDMRRMQGVLTEDQTRRLAELKKKEEEEEAKLSEAQTAPISKSTSEPGSLIGAGQLAISPGSMPSSGITEGEDDVEDDDDEDDLDYGLLDSNNETLSPLPRSSQNTNSASIPITSSPHQVKEADQSRMSKDPDDLQPLSQSCPEKEIRTSPVKIVLSEAMEQAITAPRVEEEEALGAMLAAARGPRVVDELEADAVVARRTVSDKEWDLLQKEMRAAREKLGRPCDMCANYEAQLVAAQSLARAATTDKDLAEKTATEAEERMEKERKMRLEMEDKVMGMSEEMHANTLCVKDATTEAEETLQAIKEELLKAVEATQDQLKRLGREREQVSEELRRLQLENEDLVGKHSVAAQEMQNESIALPNNLDDMQLLLLKFREDIITAKVAKEHLEENLRSEIMFLKDQVQSEQEERSRVEEALNNDLTSLQAEKTKLESLDSELERERKVKSEIEQQLKDLQAQNKSLQAKSRQIIQGLKDQVEDQSSSRIGLEEEVQSLRTKIQSLQQDLDNSEAVQRDFVKLSQSLQVQLEKFRASETEVRWQHEDDVDACTNCQAELKTSTSRSKHHCRHCGKIFCSDCTSKSVPSGAAGRAARVCDVCHTILVPEAQPFFSRDPANSNANSTPNANR